MVKAVVFDLGGTLIEYAGHYETWPELETPGFTAVYHHLSNHHLSLPSFDDFLSTGFALLPHRWRQAVAHERNLTVVGLLTELFDKLGIAVSAAQLAAAARHYEQAIQDQAWLVPGAETVKTVKASGFQVGLLSNTMFQGDAHRADLAKFDLLDAFDALLFSGDVGLWKPNAAPFLHLLAQMNVQPETAVYVGDDPASDIVGGQRAGMRVVYVKSTQRFHKPENCQPDAEINHLGELIQILQNWG